MYLYLGVLTPPVYQIILYGRMSLFLEKNALGTEETFTAFYILHPQHKKIVLPKCIAGLNNPLVYIFDSSLG